LEHIEVAQGNQQMRLSVWVKQTPNLIPAGHRWNRERGEQDHRCAAGRNLQDYKGDVLALLPLAEILPLSSKWTQKHCLVYLGKSQNLDKVAISRTAGTVALRGQEQDTKSRDIEWTGHSYLFCPITKEESALNSVRKAIRLVSNDCKCNIIISISVFGILYSMLIFNQFKSL